jgi:pyruvate formate lyase activating enzyme
VKKVEILPFPKIGEYKWEQLGYQYLLKNIPEPSPELVGKTKEIFKQYGIEVQ